MVPVSAKVGAERYRELMAELPATIDHIGSSDQRSVTEFAVLLGHEQSAKYLAELVEALEAGSDPS